MKTHHISVVPAFALSGISLALLSAPVQALTFGSGDFRGQFNSTLTLGAGWRTQGIDGDFVSPGNTGRPSNVGNSGSVTDDGNLNYDKGDMYSLVFKGLHDLDLQYKQFGFFTRFKYWYDYALDQNEVPHGNSPNGYTPDEALSDDGFSNLGSFKGVALLDAYFYYSFNAGKVPIDLRLGRQVVSWGESTFIQNGVNIINPVDVSALRRPGADLKEALLPVGMLFGSFGLTSNLSMEAFYQFEWQRTELDTCGTMFSTADPGAEGCNATTLFNSLPDQTQLGEVSLAGLTLPGTVYRAKDDEPSNTGQYGISFKYFAESLGSTEFGLYYVNNHNTTPIYSGVNGDFNAPLQAPQLGEPKPQYKMVFPEDRRIFAATFNTNIMSWSVGGELSYRPNMALAINTTDIVQAVALGPLGAPWTRTGERTMETFLAEGVGSTVQGYDDVQFTQLQFTFIKQWFQTMGASAFTFVGEIGGNYINGMETTTVNGEEVDQRYGRSPTYGQGDFESFTGVLGPVSCTSAAPINPNNVADNCTNRGYITDYAWGYRMRGVWQYSDVIGGINMSPQIAWSHDVEGNSPPPNFTQGRKAVGLSVDADYLQRYTASLSYNVFFGGDYNDTKDRDFIALSVGFNF